MKNNNSNCTYNMQGSLTFDDTNYTLQALYYCLYMSFFTILQLYSVNMLIKRFTEDEQEANKVIYIFIFLT